MPHARATAPTPGRDSVPLGRAQKRAAGASPAPQGAGARAAAAVFTPKGLLALFAIFLVVVSDAFTDGVLSGFRGGVRCRTPTLFGVGVQGVFLVLFYVIALNLIGSGLV